MELEISRVCLPICHTIDAVRRIALHNLFGHCPFPLDENRVIRKRDIDGRKERRRGEKGKKHNP